MFSDRHSALGHPCSGPARRLLSSIGTPGATPLSPSEPGNLCAGSRLRRLLDDNAEHVAGKASARQVVEGLPPGPREDPVRRPITL